MKKLYVALSLCFCVVLLESGIKYSSVPPQGRTGATGTTCRSCHGDFALNSNGSVSISGLPTSGYVNGTGYPFSLTITHTTADRMRWGFSIKAVNSTGASIGSFSTTNSNAGNNGSELSHNGAPTTAASGSYTFNNLKWTAPPSGSDPVTFYYVGNASNNSGGTDGDYIYAGTSMFTLPLKLISFTASNESNAVYLRWQTASEVNTNYFDIERSDDAQFYASIGKVNTTQNASSIYLFKDSKAASSGGNIFYRLKMVDKDGKSRYSNAISIKPHNISLVINKVYPTIINANDKVNVELVSEKNTSLTMTVIDENGKVYFTQNTALSQGENNFKVNLPSTLPRGMIFIKFNTDNFQQTESIIVR